MSAKATRDMGAASRAVEGQWPDCEGVRERARYQRALAASDIAPAKYLLVVPDKPTSGDWKAMLVDEDGERFYASFLDLVRRTETTYAKLTARRKK